MMSMVWDTKWPNEGTPWRMSSLRLDIEKLIKESKNKILSYTKDNDF